MHLITGILFPFIFLLLSCSQKGSGQSSGSFSQIAINKLDSGYETSFNSDSTFVLCLQKSKPTPAQPNTRLKFIVMELKDNKLVLEDSVLNGSAEWISNEELKVYRRTGIPDNPKSTADTSTYIYNVKTGEKIKPNTPEPYKK